MRIDVEEVKALLRAEDVIEAYGLDARRFGATYRLKECPNCGATSSSRGIIVNPGKRRWGHYGHGKLEGGSCYGTLIDLVAVCEGLDPRRDFQRVLARAAQIAGVGPSVDTAERERRRAASAQREQEQLAHELRERVAHRAQAREMWEQLAVVSDDGDRYLADRGLHASNLVLYGRVRFTWNGDVAVRLFALDDGEIETVVRRVIRATGDGDDPKVRVPRGGTQRGTLVGSVRNIGARDTMIVEGVMDALTAAQLWPDRLILGASGAGQMPAIARAAAPRIASAGGRLWLVPHNGDKLDVGRKCAVAAGVEAADAGLVLGESLLVLELAPHKDLNDAHRAGWVP